MKKIFLLFLYFTICSFSQEKEYKYHFDYFTKFNVKIYSDNRDFDTYIFKNSKDSTYSLELRYSIIDTIASILDYKANQMIKFDADFKFDKISDLEKLKISKLYKRVYFNKIKRKKFHEEMQYEHDTINNQIIVHITQFKNSKKKKIINEHYCFFAKNDNIKPIIKSIFKDNLIDKYKLEILDNYNLEKTLHLIDGKIDSQYLTCKIEKVDYNFSFKIEEINSNNSTHRISYK